MSVVLNESRCLACGRFFKPPPSDAEAGYCSTCVPIREACLDDVL